MSPLPSLSTYPLLSASQAGRYGQAYWKHAAPILRLFKSTFIFWEGLGIKQKLFTQMWMAYLFAPVFVLSGSDVYPELGKIVKIC